ncbi:hypothetical protein PIB19_07220 [Sphingomonas sp. 7/4-4]|uniref:hypothetical protein n=1 Tax=Sphingomonas sp. 7/4-4 TaxID=3018446 RepID=UPI0022F3E048|nr:hypothetical protein [Sphingomonas sp. 7/4-4]WBY09139.1 hypothetical protein PIB19_07220 [Sphingomonas sp. 7/4-4]
MSLRLGGLALLVLASLAARMLRTRATAGAIDYDATAWLLAAITFLCSSTGAAFLFTGPHLFAPVRIAKRWRRRGD